MRLTALACVLLTVLAGCTPGKQADEPVKPAWQRLQLPQPPDTPGRVMLRDAVTCGGNWYITGSVMLADGDTRPAAWKSTDGEHWTNVVFAPRSYYGSRSVVYTAGCRDGKLAAAGAKSGGAHGNPRISTWYERPDGSMDEVLAYFEMYGGNTAVDAAHLVGGPKGWMIAGNRTSGAAVWYSADAQEFKILEGAPELTSDDRGRVWATDVVGQANNWTLVGSLAAPGKIDRDPLTWTSADGEHWTRQALPASSEDEVLERIILMGDQRIAAGQRGQTFALWGDQGGWHELVRFGAAGGKGLAEVTGMGALKNLYVMTGDGDNYRLFSYAAGKVRAVDLPVGAPAGSDRKATVTGAGDRLVVLVDDGAQASAWIANG
jgi:hypothetical protein